MNTLARRSLRYVISSWNGDAVYESCDTANLNMVLALSDVRHASSRKSSSVTAYGPAFERIMYMLERNMYMLERNMYMVLIFFDFLKGMYGGFALSDGMRTSSRKISSVTAWHGLAFDERIMYMFILIFFHFF